MQVKYREFDVGNVTACCELVPRVSEANTWTHMEGGGLNTNPSSLAVFLRIIPELSTKPES